MDLTGLGATGTCHLTTTGRRSGREVTVEIWYVVVDGHVVITGTPGARDWLANLRADPRAIVRLPGHSDPEAVIAREVVDPEERRRIVPGIWAAQPWYASHATVADWVARSPIVRLTSP